MDRNNSFCSPWRRCASCGKLRDKGNYARCSKCKVFVYCDKECQTKHWKAEHKATCKPQSHIPPALPTFTLPVSNVADDLDKPYRYILINPPTTSNLTRDEWLDTAQGVTDEQLVKDLDALILAQPGERLNSSLMNVGEVSNTPEQKARAIIVKKLQTMFKWNTLGSSPIPGFSASYDGYTLRRLYDDNNSYRPELGANRSAEVLCMQGDKAFHGTLLIWCSANGEEARQIAKLQAIAAGIDVLPDPEYPPGYNPRLPELNPDISHLPPPPCDVIVPITRRSVLNTIEHNEQSGAVGALPERIHFENISRASALSFFKKQNFTVL